MNFPIIKHLHKNRHHFVIQYSFRTKTSLEMNLTGSFDIHMSRALADIF